MCAEEFATTHWTLIQAAARRPAASDSKSKAALEELCGRYWSPVYAFLRRRGKSEAEAEDLTQGFFVHLLKTDLIGAADEMRGRFRSFLLKSVSNFVIAADRSERAIKRGGTTTTLSFDFVSEERRFQRELSSPLTPEQLFERRWALTLLENTMAQVRREYHDRNQGLLFNSLEPHINQDALRIPYAELSPRLNLSEDAIKKAVRRLKLRYRTVLRSEIASTLGAESEVDDELRLLMQALGAS